MHNPIIFLATADQDLEDATIDATLRSGHEIQRARNFHYACQILGTRTVDIGLAIIDLNLEERGRSLANILAGCGHPYPIVVVTENPDLVEQDEILAQTVVAVLSKPVVPYDLDEVIEKFCRSSAAFETIAL
jgi:FixJ family two-component response regulator